MADVTIFAPSPTLTVTVEDHPSGSEIHVHAGGQGVWQARMLLRLGLSVTMCSVLTGEIGGVLHHLLEDEGVELQAVVREGRGSGYVHDRREGGRESVAEEEGDPLGRHDLDELYGLTLKEAMASGTAVLSGPAGEEALPADTYRRLAADLRAAGVRVIADLAGDRLTAVLRGGVDVVKVSDAELVADGSAADTDVDTLLPVMHRLRAQGADTVIVTRADQPFLLVDGEGAVIVSAPQLEIADSRGAGDSLTAGVTAGLARGESVREAVTLGAAAGAMNVTRHGLGTGDGDAIWRLRSSVKVSPLTDEADGGVEQPVTGRVSPEGLAALAQPDDGEES